MNLLQCTLLPKNWNNRRAALGPVLGQEKAKLCIPQVLVNACNSVL